VNTKPYHTNHFGLYTLYNGANKVYAHTLVGQKFVHVKDEKGRTSLAELPVAAHETSLLAGEFKSPRTSLEDKLVKSGVLPRNYRTGDKKRKLRDWEAMTYARALSPVESYQ